MKSNIRESLTNLKTEEFNTAQRARVIMQSAYMEARNIIGGNIKWDEIDMAFFDVIDLQVDKMVDGRAHTYGKVNHSDRQGLTPNTK